MTDTAELATAIAAVKRVTSADDPWTAEEFWLGAYDPSDIARSIATILNAVASGDLAEVIALRAEVERLRRLDAEYGRVEAAIIMADAEFDGDSDHANCGDRLIASVERLQARAEKAEAEIEGLRAHIANLRTTWTLGDLRWSDFENALRALSGEKP